MGKQALSISQMQELQELGIDISNASMCWIRCTDGNKVFPYIPKFRDIFENRRESLHDVITPTFSLQDILEMLPREWEIGAYNDNRTNITLFLEDDETLHCHQEVSESLLDAAFKMLKWYKQFK